MEDSLIILFLIYVVCSLAVMWSGYRYLVRKFNKTMELADEAVQSLIDGNPRILFRQTQDSLLGKFQSQLLKLYRILNSYEEREKKLRGQLESNVSNLVHQLNTPITNIRLYSAFLAQEELCDEERLEFAEKLGQQSDKLCWLGEGFAKVARLETGIIRLNPKRQDILPVILDAIDQITLKAKRKKNEIVLKGRQDLKAVFDEKWTEEVFFNILDNAVKYSAENTNITVEIMEYDMYVRVNVTDFGLKIPETDYPRIYRRFYRSRQAMEQEGLGLGLYLARMILEEEAGYIQVGETEDKATRFSVFLLKYDKRKEN